MADNLLDNRNENFLDYSKISFEDTLEQFQKLIKLQPTQTLDFFNSSTGKMFLELFAAVNEMGYRGIETGVLEGFTQTLTKFSSAVVSSGSMGYSIRRPSPSLTSFRVALTGAANSYSGSIVIPKFSSFTVNGVNFITPDEYVFTWDYSGTVTPPPEGASLYQGEFKSVSFKASEGTKFQKFIINDPTFSDYFGASDPLASEDPSLRVTSVTVDGEAWEVDRRTLYNVEQDTSSTAKYRDGVLILSNNKKCIIRTNSEGNIQVEFGDGIISSIPSGDIVVNYLSTLGANGNIPNSKDLQIQYASTASIIYNPVDSLTDDNLVFFLNDSADGGDDIESVQSIVNNSPMIYAALDRAVTTDDYIALLRTMPSVKYAIAYGEDQLGSGDYRYFNVVLYTVLNAIYVGTAGNLAPATPAQYICSGFNTLSVAQGIQDNSGYPAAVKSTFDSKFDLKTLTNDLSTQEQYQNYVETMGSLFRLTPQNIDVSSQLGYINKILKKKAQSTCRHLYHPPKVHKFRMKVKIFVNPISSKNTIASTVQQKAYTYLKDNTQFNFPIYSSKIIKIIESLKSIIGCHVSFVPSADIPNDSTYIDTLLTDSNEIADELFDSLNQIQTMYGPIFDKLNNNGTLDSSLLQAYERETFSYANSTLINYQNLKEQNVSNFINFVWQQTVGKLILNPLVFGGVISSINALLDSKYSKNIEDGGLISSLNNEHVYDTFIRWAVQFRKDTNYYTAKYTIDKNGDISNFDIPSEIAQVEIDTVNDIDIETKII